MQQSFGDSGKDIRGGMAVEIDGLTKTFGPTVALNNVSLQLSPGATMLIAGPNGSGKSTLLKIICGVIKRPRLAKVVALGLDPWKQRHLLFKKTSASFEDFGFPDFMTGLEYLRFVCNLRGIATIPEFLRGGEFLGIASFWTSPIRTYSSGMRRKLAAAQALVSSPVLLILDEPLVALDRKSRNELVALLQQRRLEGKSTMISSHILTGLEHVATDLLVLVDGSVRMMKHSETEFLDLELTYAQALESF